MATKTILLPCVCYSDVHQVRDVTKGYINGPLISVFHVMNIQLRLYLCLQS